MGIFTIYQKSDPEKMLPVSWAEAASLMVHMPSEACLSLKLGETNDLILEIRKTFLQGRCQLLLVDQFGTSFGYDVMNRKPFGTLKMKSVFTRYGAASLSVFEADEMVLLSCVSSFILDRESRIGDCFEPIPELSGFISMLYELEEPESVYLHRGKYMKKLWNKLREISLYACRYQLQEEACRYPEGPLVIRPGSLCHGGKKG